MSIAATGFFAPRKVNPSDKLSLYGSATVADLPGQPGSGALAATAMTYEWSTAPQLNLSDANITGGGGPWRRSLFLLPYALQLSAGTYRLTLTARLATGSSAYASVALLVNAPPYGGTLRLAFAGSEARALAAVNLSATGWTDDTDDLPLTYSFAYLVAVGAGGGGGSSPAATPTNNDGGGGAAAGGGAVVQQIRGRDAAQSTSFSPSAGNGSAILTVHDVWGGKAMASELLNVVPVKLDTALMGSVLAQIGDLSASALASNSSKGNAAATQLVGALAATLNMQVTSYLSLLLLGDFLLLATYYLPLCLTRRAPRPRLRATCRASPTQRCSSCARASSPSSPPDRRP